MAPRKRCPVCRSKQWHKEPSSGLIACSEGHILQNYRNEATEVDEIGPHAMRKRALKSSRKKKTETSDANSKLYHGVRGRYFYFQCLQLILRHQIAILTKRWELPAEFEVVCRDLWALHLSLLREPPPPNPYPSAEEEKLEEDEPVDDEDADPTASTLKREKSATPPPEDPFHSSDDSDADDMDNDPELDELLAENSASDSSSSDGEDEVDTRAMPPQTAKSKHTGRHKYDRPLNTLAVIVLACWNLRVPILYRDLTRLIESYELPYLEPMRVLPPNMTEHLTKYNIQALCPPNAPNAVALHTATSSLARRIYSSYGVMTPEVNAAPILWRVVSQCLGGSPTLYRLTKRLASLLSLPLTLHSSLAPRLQRVKSWDPERHKYDNIAPELAFLATGMIVLKMVYGLDGKSRLPTDADDPACDLPQIDEYLGVLRRLEEADRRTKDVQFHSKTVMVIEDLGEDTVDEYLEFCERALVGPGNMGNEDVLDRYFPLRAGHETMGNAIATEGERRELVATGVQDGEEEGVLRPGESYTMYHSGEMPEGYAGVVGRVAMWTGVREEYLCHVVESYERRLQRWWLSKKRNNGRLDHSENSSSAESNDECE